jgi:hypothetical protein
MSSRVWVGYSLAIVTLTLAPIARAFHDGGVAACIVCHTMHNSENGVPLNPTADNNFLLAAESPTDLCLSCHATSSGAVWASAPLTPAPEHGAGNFIFAAEDNVNDAPNGFQFPLTGSAAVHNCVSLTYGVPADPQHVDAPGGTFPSTALGCTSCHDPHGNTNYRMLRGVGPLAEVNFSFMFPAPVAVGIDPDGAAESATHHTAYRSGWSQWCANCHGLFHEGGTGFQHPVDQPLGSDVRQSYERYAGSADTTDGDPATSYLPQLPFEDPLVTVDQAAGPSNTSRISCITCHRSHGSSAPDLGRWDFSVLDLNQDGLVSGSHRLPVPYGGANQRQLCVKCHEPQARDHGRDEACIECHRMNDLMHLPRRFPTMNPKVK